jgi:hypothetical protein
MISIPFSYLMIIAARICLWLSLCSITLAADECEVVKTYFYERTQGDIVTDWQDVFAYKDTRARKEIGVRSCNAYLNGAFQKILYNLKTKRS